MVLDISDIPTILVIAGIVFIFIAIVRELSGYFKASITPKQAIILGITGVILLGLGLFASSTGVFLPKPTPTPTVTPSPSPTITPTPTPTATPLPTITPCIIDPMESTMGWDTYKDDKGSSMNIKSIHGRTDNAIKISYDLKEWGWLVISKKINPEKLSDKEGINFFYKGSGEPNTIELKLIYEDTTTFGVAWHKATVADNWVSIEVPYGDFECWWPDDNCLRYGNKLDLTNVRKIEFAISNKPEGGDMYGSGRVIIDDVQGICPK